MYHTLLCVEWKLEFNRKTCIGIFSSLIWKKIVMSSIVNYKIRLNIEVTIAFFHFQDELVMMVLN